MKLEHPELLARLADEYVVGTMAGAARRRFDRVCVRNGAAAAAVRAAEDRLLGLSLALEPVAPAPATWHAIVAQTGGAVPARPTRNNWLAALAAVVAMTAMGLAWFMWQRTEQPQVIAQVTTPQGATLWAVQAYSDGERLEVVASDAVRAEPGRSFELWALPEGGAPVSLGLLPETGKLARDMTAAQRAALQSTAKVAVSLEPRGGSPTGAPTGPVLYVVTLQRTG